MGTRTAYAASVRSAVVLLLFAGFAAALTQQMLLRRWLTRAAAFVDASYHEGTFDDPYLQYVYPAESLPCAGARCPVTYRQLDAYFSVALFAASRTVRGMDALTNDAHATFAALQPLWRTANINNVTTSVPEGQAGEPSGGVALDTYCILGYVTRDAAMAAHAAAFLDAANNWIENDAFPESPWRRIADETWCIRLLAVTEGDAALVRSLTEAKVAEANAFLAGGASAADRAAVLVHMVGLLEDVQLEPEQVRTYVESLTSPELLRAVNEQTLILAGIVDAVEATPWATMLPSGLVATLRHRQLPSGGWEERPGSGALPVFTTLRVMAALSHALRI